MMMRRKEAEEAFHCPRNAVTEGVAIVDIEADRVAQKTKPRAAYSEHCARPIRIKPNADTQSPGRDHSAQALHRQSQALHRHSAS